jgi:NAD(P)-dependent dehydrogenase (short-subunit alcohol dehydrogenase family)
MTREIVHALGALGKPDDLIGVAVFLASPAFAFVNRQILYVDGDLLAVV